MNFKMIKSGFLSTIQDYGRFGYGKNAMSKCGAMDEHAYAWGNYLLDNEFSDAALEITFGDTQIQAEVDTIVAVTGANLDFQINGECAPIWHSITISRGDILSWGKPKSGVRSYLAVKGGFNTEILFGSRSVNLREGIGTQLKNGDKLPCVSCRSHLHRFTPDRYIPCYDDDITLRLLPTYQFSQFNAKQKALFFNQTYQISQNSDRVACHLINAQPILMKVENTISEPMSYGSVEITTDGMPIILLKDAPTIGGYPKIGTVFSLDLAKLAQKQANTDIKFKIMDINLAQLERNFFNNFFKIN